MYIHSAALIQFIRYAFAGVLATCTHIVVFHLIGWRILPALQTEDHAVRLLKLSIRPIDDSTRARNAMIGNCSAFLISNMVAYLANVLWVFQGGRYNFFIEIVLFYSVSGISVLLGTMLMGVLVRRFGLLTTYALTANIFISLMINYVVRKFLIFSG